MLNTEADRLQDFAKLCFDVCMLLCGQQGMGSAGIKQSSAATDFFLESLKLMRFLCPSIRMEEEEEEEVRDKGLFVALKISCA